MKTFRKIADLVMFSLTDKTGEDAICIIRKVSAREAEIIKAVTGKETAGYVHIIDRSSVVHTIKKHGNEEKERSRGQIAVSIADFELAEEIIKGENLIHDGYTKDGKPLFLYSRRIGSIYYYSEEVRTQRGKLCLKTIFKRK